LLCKFFCMLRQSMCSDLRTKHWPCRDPKHWNHGVDLVGYELVPYLKNSMWGVRQSFNNLSVLYRIPQPRIYSKLTCQQSSKQGVVSCKTSRS
jgi:hypothetical protein